MSKFMVNVVPSKRLGRLSVVIWPMNRGFSAWWARNDEDVFSYVMLRRVEIRWYRNDKR
ncbi:hypothetical protein LCGC14_1864720 [marine sediment metagenome]|uniref:Uncharacterized protein n=1 Tax=marine sediment metagenome TaxID=412755 RepID=A0A0F9G6J5_9ZZZZ